MKLYTSDGAELMEVTGLKSDGANLVVVGTIMGAMPIEANLKPTDLRQVFKLLTPGLIWATIRMLFSK